ncbi:MAG: hypothetical protein NT001_05340 [Candidatus Woesearchaeota archaeon]|nr:hypothetical protein [Candidatus Woesearchaeota archaeon]
MDSLFIDNFVRDMGFETTEDYIENCLEERDPLLFDSVKYFTSLYSAGLLPEGVCIRTSDKMRNIDHTYCVDGQGNLVGITNCPYPGEKGTFKPEEILIGERVYSGWTIENPMRFSHLFGEWSGNNEE